MDAETGRYIVSYFSHLLTAEEKMAWKHTATSFKTRNSPNKEGGERLYKKLGWLTEDQDILSLLAEGYDKFEQRVAERILREHPDKVFLNNCPKCGRLARTPMAKQCRHCGYNWHSSTE